MKINLIYRILPALLLLGGLSFSCERDLEDFEPAEYPTNGDVFIDGFSGGLNYAAFGGSKPTAFQVDTEVKYEGTSSMRFAVPDFEDPEGAYAGGSYFLNSGRNLSGYTTLTFWAKASQPGSIDVIGFGNDLGANRLQASISGLGVNTNWQKYYIPIPDPAKLTEERGMFFYSEGPENERGYTFWIDNVQFENIGTITGPEGFIFNGEERVVTAEGGSTFNAEGFVNFNLPTGVDQRINTAPAYFNFVSSNPEVATVDEAGIVTVLTAGEAVITATIGDEAAKGSLTVTSTGQPTGPTSAAPTPTYPAEDVVSIYSNAYTNVPVDFYNGFWMGSTTNNTFPVIDGDEVIRYFDLNFVGIQFTNPTQDITTMTHLRMDIWTPSSTTPPAEFKILLFDVGANGTFGDSDDSQHELVLTSPTISSENWVTLEIPLTDFPGLTNRDNLAQVVLSGDLSTVFVDNVLFYRGETMGTDIPDMAAPTPTRAESDVISVFSDAYTNIADTDLNPDWGQATVVSQQDIMGNNTLVYNGLNYQGIQLGSAQDLTEMEFLHIDFWSANSTLLQGFIISPGPIEQFVGLNVPTSGWGSIDIPLGDFAPVDLADVIQLKFDGNGDIYLDNIYFYKESSVGGSEPTTAAPTPTVPSANVISLFSDSYTDVPVDTWRTEWSDATFEDVDVAGNPTKKYSNLNFVGIETVNNQIDASAMTSIHFDVWSPDATLLKFKLVDFGPDGAFQGGDDTEFELIFEAPAQSQWVSYEIPLSEFTGLLNRNNIAQFIFAAEPVGATTVWIDNLYFHN